MGYRSAQEKIGKEKMWKRPVRKEYASSTDIDESNQIMKTIPPSIEKGKFTKYFYTKNKKPTAPGIPRRSPIQVLTGPDVA